MTIKAELQAGSLASAPLQSRPTPLLRVLVVGDDPYSYHLSAEVLIGQGYEVNVAEDGKAGWEELRANSYGLLITDDQMPKMSGIGLSRKLRTAHMNLPVILVSETGPTKQLKRYGWLPIDATLLKPIIPDELLATVTRVLRANSARQQIVRPRNPQPMPASGLGL